ncbi:MAG: hypothetical protein R2818_12005 [Flavobacteriales bacterium]
MSIAQPALDVGIFPSTGSVFGYHDVPYMKPGVSGEGVRWDVSSLPPGTIVPHVWSTTDIAPGAGAFPNDALVRQVPGEPASYFLRSDTAMFWIGTYTDTALLRFDPPLRELVVPCQIGDRWSDTSIVAVTGAGRIRILDVYYAGRAESWGDLIMPYGVVEDVIRVRTEAGHGGSQVQGVAATHRNTLLLVFSTHADALARDVRTQRLGATGPRVALAGRLVAG